jgi:hypothetical protein
MHKRMFENNQCVSNFEYTNGKSNYAVNKKTDLTVNVNSIKAVRLFINFGAEEPNCILKRLMILYC